MSRNFKIGDRWVGPDHPPFVIAELSGNHNQSLERALEITKAAADAGAYALKLQTYTADLITINQRGGLFEISDPRSLWNGYSLYELYQEAYTPWEWHGEIFEYARSLGMLAFSSPCDSTSVDFLEDLDVPAHKIASFDSTNYPLLRHVARTGKPVIISSGAADLDDIIASVQYLREHGAEDIVVLKCTSTYPASPANTNLRTIPTFESVFPDCVIGLSDHTMGIGASVAAVALGARVIEKHFTLRRADGGVDSAFSMEPKEMKALVEESRSAFQALGEVQLHVQPAEKKSLNYRRSVYVVTDLKAGDVLNDENLRIIRPGDGMDPREYERVLGKTVRVDLPRGTPFSLDYI
ncbi:pseudaminic acid synthase [Lewinella aquimaris]|uniref:Pseudaminic acid synthase n=1 Tax=Neolewinella aquimaris TaxID=1835722 RepID=A0A840E3P4_9BACT|nr:pseudaminic acid synthase [Neolewinella aquimaris]MBB4080204.1 pseudaminic acid synthase [Neolewinella aquimaris]